MRRNRLVTLHPDAWTAILAREWHSMARACLTHWAAQSWPLVVTAQLPMASIEEPQISLGLAAPLQWDRLRLALLVPDTSISAFSEFPLASQISNLLPPDVHLPWSELISGVTALGASMHVFGSYGWQRLTGLTYVRDKSDIDLCIAVDSLQQADAVAALLQAFAPSNPRLDGELMFSNGEAVHWREWARWREGSVHQLLVKRLNGAVLTHILPCQHEAVQEHLE